MALRIDDHGYTMIVRWGVMLGSSAEYVQDQCDLALREDAPRDAIYKAEQRWVLAGEVTNPASRSALGLPQLEQR